MFVSRPTPCLPLPLLGLPCVSAAAATGTTTVSGVCRGWVGIVAAASKRRSDMKGPDAPHEAPTHIMLILISPITPCTASDDQSRMAHQHGESLGLITWYGYAACQLRGRQMLTCVKFSQPGQPKTIWYTTTRQRHSRSSIVSMARLLVGSGTLVHQKLSNQSTGGALVEIVGGHHEDNLALCRSCSRDCFSTNPKCKRCFDTDPPGRRPWYTTCTM